MDRTRVRFIAEKHPHNEMKRFERGYIDGYVRGGDDRPYAIVVKDNGKIVMCSINQLERVPFEKVI